jgi:hypothetical protein
MQVWGVELLVLKIKRSSSEAKLSTPGNALVQDKRQALREPLIEKQENLHLALQKTDTRTSKWKQKPL